MRFVAHEVEVIHSAEPTPVHDLIAAWKRTGRGLAVGSNNSSMAIEMYLNLYDLHQLVDHVAARTNADKSILKPHPHLLVQAINMSIAESSRSTFVGESSTDFEAAEAARVVSIGYANKPSKTDRLLASNPAIVTTDMTFLLPVVGVLSRTQEPIDSF